MIKNLLIPLLLALLVSPTSSSITDGADPVGITVTITPLPGNAGAEVVLSITDEAEPIPEVSAAWIGSITDGADPVPVSAVSLTQKGGCITVYALLDEKAVDGSLVVYLAFAGTEPVGFWIDLASITEGADPV